MSFHAAAEKILGEEDGPPPLNEIIVRPSFEDKSTFQFS